MSKSISTYINPLTDFGFKYIFGRNADKEAYNKSLKAYRDAYAIAQTERAEGRADERVAIATNMIKMNMTDDIIVQATSLTPNEIQALRISIGKI